MSATRLLADIGGTNARFARCNEAGEIFGRRAYLVAEADFSSTLARYLAETADLGMPASAALAAAGPVRRRVIKLTNADWIVSADAVAAVIGDVPVGIFNDLEAVAMSLPHLTGDDVSPLPGPLIDRSGHDRMLAVNVGTGFGAASVAPIEGHWVAAPSEAGHMSFGATKPEELALLGGKTGFTVEHVLSGPGLLALYRRHSANLGTVAVAETAEEVFGRAKSDRAAADTLDYFTIWLARASRNLVLATASWGGVYFVGSVAQSWAGLVALELFREHFVDGGKMAALLAETPLAVVLNDDPALLGLANARLLPRTS